MIKLIRFFRLLMLPAILALAASACNDDNNFPDSSGNDLPEEKDSYIGQFRDFVIDQFQSDIQPEELVCKIMTPDGSIISRKCDPENMKAGKFRFFNGLKEGKYRLLYFEYPTQSNEAIAELIEKFPTAEIGLGCEIEVSGKNGIRICQDYNRQLGMFGKGTKDAPYEISSYEHLFLLMLFVNNHDTNRQITPSTYFRQTVPINMYRASIMCDQRYGWYPIGADTNTPFCGVYLGNEISGLWCDRKSSAGIGLFGYLHNAVIDGVAVKDSELSGNFAVGAVAGAVIAAGDDHGDSSLINCSVEKSSITGGKDSFAVGGIIGCADMHSAILLGSCRSSDSDIRGSYNVGGIIGGAARYSRTVINDCENSSTITSEYSGAGGMIGAADTLYVTSCRNKADIAGAIQYNSSDNGNSGIGVGGIVGGSGISFLTACRNEGTVSGADGVGGIIGSTRVKGDASKGDAYLFNNTFLRWCANNGNVSGTNSVGGMCGEAQFGCYGAINKGNISGNDYVAGIVGNTSVAVAHNAINTGNIDGHSYCSGVVGKTSWGSIAISHNYGHVKGSGSHTAGVLGLGGNNTIVHYCGNYARIANSGNGPTAGIIAEIGDPREWTALNIAECVVASLEMVMSVAGPLMAIVEEAVEASSEVAAAIIKVSEVLIDSVLNKADRILWGFGLHEILNPEVEEELTAAINEVAVKESEEISNEMAAWRSGYSLSISNFNAFPITSSYNNAVQATLDYYETGENDERFNDRINETRIERMEQLEHIHHTSEIVHQVIGGVAILASTVAIVGGAIASGGAAVPFIVLGSSAAFVGGLNALTKTCTDFKENAVIVSQCLNTGNIEASNGKCGGLVGVLQDNSILRNSLNVGNGPKFGDTFVGNPKKAVKIKDCLSLSDLGSWSKIDGNRYDACIVYSDENLSEIQKTAYYDEYAIYKASVAEIGDPSLYKNFQRNWVDAHSQKVPVYFHLFWDVNNPASTWYMEKSGSGFFPVPTYSEMRD